mmetsp:Transcript_7210/g.18724  ORF Transcript_7210/g.18724 Transcript_7210/m.18724 type:complete len:216 (-) Transcript_7210:726-1373(-)
MCRGRIRAIQRNRRRRRGVGGAGLRMSRRRRPSRGVGCLRAFESIAFKNESRDRRGTTDKDSCGAGGSRCAARRVVGRNRPRCDRRGPPSALLIRQTIEGGRGGARHRLLLARAARGLRAPRWGDERGCGSRRRRRRWHRPIPVLALPRGAPRRARRGAACRIWWRRRRLGFRLRKNLRFYRRGHLPSRRLGVARHRFARRTAVSRCERNGRGCL